MARLKKKNNISGYIDGKSHYTMNGKDYIKNSSAPDSDRLKYDPVYAPVRINFNLFGSLSTVVSVFRNALKPLFKDAMEVRSHGSLVSLFHSMVRDGKPVLNLRDHKKVLCSYVFKKNVYFDGKAKYVPYEIICSEDRSLVRLKLKPFEHRKRKEDGNCTHFRMTVGVLFFSDSMRTEGMDSVTYVSVPNPFHGNVIVNESLYINMHKLEEEQLVSIVIPVEARDETLAGVVMLHLAFYEQVNGVMYAYGQEVMKVADVF